MATTPRSKTAETAADAGANIANETARKVEAAADAGASVANEAARKVESTARAGAEIASDTARKAESVTQTGAKFANETARKVENIAAETQRNMSEHFEKFTRGIEGFTAFSQDNIDALVKSSEIAAKAAEGISSEVSAYSKKAFEDSVAAAQDIAASKSVTELFEKQTAFAQSAFEGYVAQTTKMHEIMLAATKDIAAPLGARFNAASERMKSFAL